MLTMLQDPNVVAAKKSLDVMIEVGPTAGCRIILALNPIHPSPRQLYIRGVWMDSKTVNIIAGATLSEHPKIAHTATRFFLRTNEELKADIRDGEDSDDDDSARKTADRVSWCDESRVSKRAHLSPSTCRLQLRITAPFVKKTSKRQHQLERATKAAKRAQRRRDETQPTFHFVALQDINDPQVGW